MSKEKSGMLGIRDIVFMNVIAILSLRQIGVTIRFPNT
jgi:hypothetical protein